MSVIGKINTISVLWDLFQMVYLTITPQLVMILMVLTSIETMISTGCLEMGLWNLIHPVMLHITIIIKDLNLGQRLKSRRFGIWRWKMNSFFQLPGIVHVQVVYQKKYLHHGVGKIQNLLQILIL